MARNDDRNDRSERNDGGERDEGRDLAREAALDTTRRDRYRDDDDQRDRLASDERVGSSPDTKSEARGSARENVGDTAHDQKDRDLKDRSRR